MIQHLGTADYQQMLWKNGAGNTIELARSDGDSLDTFDWRISMADVKTSGDFSKFNGMQRILTVLEGAGIILNIDDDTEHLKTLQSAQFSGDSTTSCELSNGPIRDFNLIYNPEKWNSRYQWMCETTITEIFSTADLIFIFNHSQESLEIEVKQQIFCLAQHESLQIQQPKSLKKLVLKSQRLQRACLIELTKN
ncbi:HutD/Ves family protein [Acinetobacter gyllenbergii]|uniref:HutD/Ves family protein n=1 Tax=Acinetobacter gyllenbergii TaxID=134534 RepID=UPI000806BD97|nr:HutD family protein [Acinetobacter gyllenbergii]OBY75636.1 histidine uptake and utilization operon protein HutD [Acinetobacter gyllenbergii]